jgi:hypothetical protein
MVWVGVLPVTVLFNVTPALVVEPAPLLIAKEVTTGVGSLGVTLLEGLDAGPVPTALVAVTVKV